MKVNIILNKKNEIVGYRTYPMDLAEPLLEAEEFPKDLQIGNYRFENCMPVKQTAEANSAGRTASSGRFSKDKLLKAFAEYRSNVNYGLILEDKATHQRMVDWYTAVNEGDAESISNPPQVIIRYLEGDSWI